MKSRLTITIDAALVEQAKHYAAKHKTSLSQLVEQYFKSLTRLARKRNILDVIRELPAAKLKVEEDGKEAYYEKQKKKHGF